MRADLLTLLMAIGAIIPLAGLIGQGTEQLAIHAGPRIGGLLNATFGNLTELIVAVFLILRGEFLAVKAPLIGSILGDLLLVMGLSFYRRRRSSPRTVVQRWRGGCPRHVAFAAGGGPADARAVRADQATAKRSCSVRWSVLW
ncbi:MAG: hypothetical protein M3O94_05565 [Actinomycetota bacterium]|nr:hypothetical protein [Actinomycetota bacterium]